jgi:hypothetical protein
MLTVYIFNFQLMSQQFKFQVKALTPEMPAIFFSADEDEGKVLVMAQVPTSVIKGKGLKANEWCQQVS